MTQIQMVADIVEANGKTIRQNNMEQIHDIKIGSLVEINYSYNENNGVRLFVVNHSRDCDGTPLYDLSYNQDSYKEYLEYEANKTTMEPNGLKFYMEGSLQGQICRHYGRESLTVIREPEEN
jgi:hypothetical protein